MISENDRAALSAAFISTPEFFNRIMSLCFVTISEICNEEFIADQTWGATEQHLASFPQLAVALLPYNHMLLDIY